MSEHTGAYSMSAEDTDPERLGERCRRCGRHNPSWSAPSPLWNAVMRGGSINGEPLYDDLVCATCFMILAEEAGIAQSWHLTAETVNARLETETPSGRIWDDKRLLWVEGRSPTDAGSGLRPYGAEPTTQSQAEPLAPNAAELCVALEARIKHQRESGGCMFYYGSPHPLDDALLAYVRRTADHVPGDGKLIEALEKVRDYKWPDIVGQSEIVSYGAATGERYVTPFPVPRESTLQAIQSIKEIARSALAHLAGRRHRP